MPPETTRKRWKRKLDFSQEQQLHDLWEEIRVDCHIANKTNVLRIIPEEYRTSTKFKNFLKLRDRVLIKNLPLIKYYVSKTAGCADDIHQDAFQQIVLQFLEDIPNFNPALGYTLHTYMRFSLLKASTQAFYDSVYCVRPSEKLVTLKNKIQAELLAGRTPTEIQEKLKISATKYQEAIKTQYIADTSRKHIYLQAEDTNIPEAETRIFQALYFKNPHEADFGKILRHLKKTYQKENPTLYESLYKFFTSDERYKQAMVKKLEKTIYEQRKRQVNSAAQQAQSG